MKNLTEREAALLAGSTACYCGDLIAPGARHVYVTVLVDWGADDLREGAAEKHYLFHSFECLGLWAADRAAAHDGVTVKEGVA